MPKPGGLELWYQAIASDIGVCVETTDRHLMSQRLYAARAAAKDPDLDGVSIVMSPTDDSHLWLIKNGKKS